MTTELVTDRHGDTMRLVKNQYGRWVAPDMDIEACNNIGNLEMRHDDVMISSYAKSGCHWSWEIIRLLLNGLEATDDKIEKEEVMLEFNTPDKLATLKSPRVMNNHGFFDQQPLSDIVTKGAKIVFIYRNLKSVATSYYFHHTRDDVYDYKATFDRYLIRFLDGLVDNDNVFSYLRGWENGILNTPGLKIHMLSYEEMKKNPLIEVKRLSKFLGKSEDEDFLSKVCEATCFDAMQQRKSEVTKFVDKDGLPIMYRKGTIGDWKNYFTVAQSEMFDKIIETELGDSQLFRFTYK